MQGVIRFHVDEHVSHDVARGLMLRGVDVTTSSNAGMLGAGDDEQLTFALRERRVIVTHDPDFLAAASSGIQHAGLVFVTSGARSIGEIVRFLCLLHDCLSDDEMHNHIEYL